MNFITNRSYRRNNYLSHEFTSSIAKDGYESVEKDSNKLKRDVIKKTEELERKEKEIEDLVVNLNKYKRENSKLKSDYLIIDNRCDSTERENVRIKSKLQALEKDKKNNDREIENLNLEVRRLESIRNFKAQNPDDHAEIIALKLSLDKLKSENESLDKRNIELQNRLRDLRKDDSSRYTRTEETKKSEKDQEKEVKITGLTKELSLLQSENQELKRKIKSLENVIQRESSKPQISHKDIEAERQIQLLQNKISNLKKEIDQSLEVERDLAKKLEIEQNELKIVRKELVRVQQETNATLSANNKSVEDNIGKFKELQNECLILKNQSNNAEKQKLDLIREKDLVAHDRDIHLNNANKLKDELKGKREVIQNLENEIVELRGELNKLKEKYLIDLKSSTTVNESLTKKYELEEKRLHNEIETLKVQVQNLQLKDKENEIFMKEANNLKHNSNEEYKIIENENVEYKKLVETALKEKINLEKLCKELNDNLNSLKAKESASAVREKDLNESINRLNQEKIDILKERQELNNRLNELNKTSESLNQENHFNDKLTLLFEEKKSLEESIQKYEQDIKKYIEQDNALKQKIKEMENVSIQNKIQNSSSDKKEDSSLLNKTILDQQNEIKQLQSELKNKNEKINTALKESADQKSSLQTLEQKIKELNVEIEKSNDALLKEKESSKNSLVNQQTLSEKIIELQKNLSIYENSGNSLKTLQREIEVKNNMIAKLNLEKELLQSSLGKKDDEISDIIKSKKNFADDSMKKKRVSKSRESLLQAEIDEFKEKFNLLNKASESNLDLKNVLKTINNPAPVKNEYQHVLTIQSFVRGFKIRKSFKDIKFRQRIAKEIYDTEKSYVDTLELIYSYYYSPLKEMIKINEPILTHEEIDNVFGGIEKIRENNRTVLKLIEERVSHWNIDKKIGDVFVQVMEKSILDPHINYIQNYNKNREYRLNLMTTNKSFGRFIKMTMILPVLESKSFDDLLINPVQRIPRYILLLSDLLKHTKSKHPDYNNISNAIKLVQDFASYLNENNRRSEKMIEIASRLSGLEELPENPNRVLIHEGSIVHVDDKERSPRYAFLFSDCIVFSKDTKKKKKSLKNQKISFSIIANIKLNSNLTVHAIGEYEQSHAFSVNISDQENIFLTRSSSEMIYWVTQIKDALSKIAKDNAKSHVSLNSNSSKSDESNPESSHPKGKRRSAKRNKDV